MVFGFDRISHDLPQYMERRRPTEQGGLSHTCHGEGTIALLVPLLHSVKSAEYLVFHIHLESLFRLQTYINGN